MDADRTEMIIRLFGVLSARLEDASIIAGDGQNRAHTAAERAMLSRSMASAAQEIAAIASAVEALADD